MNKKLEVKMNLIIGKLNSSNTTYYWKIEEDVLTKFNLGEDQYFKKLIGNYAIVENLNDFDLVKIVGVIETNDKYAKFLTNKTIRNKLLSYYKHSYMDTNARIVYIPSTFTALADYLAIDRSAMSSELKNLKDEGLIEIKNKKIKLLYFPE